MDLFGGEPSPLPDTVVRDDQLRLIFTCCHPALAPRGAGGAQPAHALRPVDGRDRPGPPGARGDDGQAPGAGQGARSPAPTSRTGCRPTTSCPIGCPAVLGVVYLVFTEGHTATSGDAPRARRPVRRGRAARPPAARAAARRARGRRPARPAAAHRRPPGDPGRRRRRPRPAGRPGPRAAGTARAIDEGAALVAEALRRSAGAPGPVPAAGRHRRLPRRRARPTRPPTGARSPSSTDCSRRARRRRSCR